MLSKDLAIDMVAALHEADTICAEDKMKKLVTRCSWFMSAGRRKREPSLVDGRRAYA